MSEIAIMKSRSVGLTSTMRSALHGVPREVAFDSGWQAQAAGSHAKANPFHGIDETSAAAFSGGFACRAAALRAGVLS